MYLLCTASKFTREITLAFQIFNLALTKFLHAIITIINVYGDLPVALVLPAYSVHHPICRTKGVLLTGGVHPCQLFPFPAITRIRLSSGLGVSMRKPLHSPYRMFASRLWTYLGQVGHYTSRLFRNLLLRSGIRFHSWIL